MHKTTFDTLVIGAGSAGCVVAARLASAGQTVGLIEAGQRDVGNSDMLDLGRWKQLVGSAHDYDYKIAPQPRSNSDFNHTRGKMLGGTSSINTCVAFVTPDYDLSHWTKLGATGWTPQDCASAFAKLRNTVHFEPSTIENSFHQDAIEAAAALGLPHQTFNAPAPSGNGIGWLDFNKKGTLRQSASVAYLHPLEQWGDRLTILTETQAEALLFAEDGAVCGVHTTAGALYATHEVVLACGAFATPKLLMLSGIGPAAHLADHNISVRHDLAGVGAHLLDHPESGLAWETNQPIPQVDLNNMALAFFANTPNDSTAPAVMGHIGTAVFDGHTTPKGYPTAAQGFTININVARARSEGSVRLQSADPSMAPRIDFQYFTDPYDEETLLNGMEFARELVQQAPLRHWIKRELFPGSDINTREQLSTYARHVSGTVYHPAGTCKMGAADDDTAVVDPQLRVRGIPNLRIADASIFPSMVGVNPNITCMMIGERCAEFILNQP